MILFVIAGVIAVSSQLLTKSQKLRHLRGDKNASAHWQKSSSLEKAKFQDSHNKNDPHWVQEAMRDVQKKEPLDKERAAKKGNGGNESEEEDLDDSEERADVDDLDAPQIKEEVEEYLNQSEGDSFANALEAIIEKYENVGQRELDSEDLSNLANFNGNGANSDARSKTPSESSQNSFDQNGENESKEQTHSQEERSDQPMSDASQESSLKSNSAHAPSQTGSDLKDL